MNFIHKAIYAFVMFIIIYVMIMLIRPFILNIPGVWPNLAPTFINKNIANLFWFLMNLIFVFVMVFLIIMYIIWKSIKMFVPNAPIPFRNILLGTSPLKELEQSGIFHLMDAIVMIVPRILSGRVKEGFIELGMAFVNFFKKSSLMIIGLFTPLAKKVPGVNVKGAPRGAEPNQGSRDAKGSSKGIKDEERRMIQQQYEQCLEENTTPITPDMSAFQKRRVRFNNSMAGTKCNLQRFRTTSDILRPF